MRICTSVFVVCVIGIFVNDVRADDPDPSNVLQEAREFAAEGKYAEALEKHLWYHENALRINPALVGVRVSFALNDWIKLGEKYPKAREALVAIRDRNAGRLSKGEGDFRLFQDTASINSYLGESNRTVETFKTLAAVNPTLARQTYRLAEEALFEAGEFQLCSEYLGDPIQKLEESTRFRSALLSSSMDGGVSANRIFSNQISRMITILARAGKTDEAEAVRKKALATLDDPQIRKAGK